MPGDRVLFPFTGIPPRKISQEGQKNPTLDTTYEKELTAVPVPEAPALLAAGIPYERLPGFRLGPQDKEKGFQKVAALFQYGKGRVARLGLAGGWGLLANASDTNDLDYEYYQSFAIKLLLWAAGKEPALQLKGFPAALTAEHSAGGSGQLAFELAGEGKYTLSLAVRSPEKLFRVPAVPVASPGVQQGAVVLRPVAQATVQVSAPGPVQIALPALPAGSYFVDVELSRDGRKAAWATAALTVTAPARIAEVKLAPPFIDVSGGKAATLAASAVLQGVPPAGSRVRFSLVDNYDCLLAEREVSVAPGAAAVEAAFPIKSFATTLGKVRAELDAGSDVLDVAVGRFTAVRRDWDRFLFAGWAGFPGDHSGNIYARVLARLGFDAGRGMKVTFDTLEAADTVALPGYSGLPRQAFDITPERQKRADEATAKLKEQLPFDPVAYYCGDEIDYGGGDELPGRIVEFRKFLQARYGTIAALNRQWDSHYASFEEVYPLARKAALTDAEKGKLTLEKEYLEGAKATGNYSRWVDQWLSNYKAFNDMARNPRKVIRAFDPHARVGVDCPMWPFTTTGHDWYTFLQEFEMFAPYGREGEIQPYEEARSYARPGTLLGMEYGGYLYNASARREELTDVEWQRWRVWHGLLRGFTSTWWYQLTPPGNESSISPGLLPVPTLEEYARQLAIIRNGYYTLYTRAKRDYGPIAIHDSIPSRLVTSLLRDFGNERPFAVHFAMQVLRNVAGRPYTFVANEQIKKGGLKGYKVLIMPSSLAIGDAEAKELRRFVQTGGLLIADVRPGIADEAGRVGDNKLMAELFGLAWKKELGRKMVLGEVSGAYKGIAIRNPAQKFPADPAVELKGAKALCEVEGIPLVTWHDVGAGTAVCLNIPFNYYEGYPTPDHLYGYVGEPDHNKLVGSILAAILQAHHVGRPVQVETPGGQWLPGLDASYHTAGAAQYVGLTKERMSNVEGESEVVVHAPRPGHVYDMLSGRYLGAEGTWRVRLAPADVQLFSILPYQVRGLKVSLKQAAFRRGTAIEGEVTIERSAGRAVMHVVNVQVTRPDGESIRYLARNLETAGGRAAFSLPLALNEPAGSYTLTFTDAASGVKQTVPAQVE